MKITRYIVITMALASSLAWGWNCPAGQARQQAPAGTPTTTPYYDVVEGISFICVPDPSKTPTPTSTAQANSNSTSSAAAGASSTSLAAGGNASSSLNNSGNSNVKVSNNLAQHQQQSQSSSNTNDNQSQGGSVSDVGNSSTVTNIPRQAPPAYAPTVLPTNCLGSLSAGASAPIGGISIGGTKRDRNCEAIVLANMFAQLRNFTASAKVLCATDAAKRAHLSMDDCLLVQAQLVAPQATLRTADIKPEPIIVQAPAPQILVIQQPIDVTPTKAQLEELKPKVIHRAKPAVKKVHVCPVTPLQNDCPVAVREK